MCALNVYVKSCGCRSEAASIGYCINAIATGRRCSQVQRREVHDSTSCARHSSHGYTSTSQPSRARSRSRTRPGDAFGGVFTASTSANRPRSRSRPREPSRSRLDATATGNTPSSGSFHHFDPTAIGYSRVDDDRQHIGRSARGGTQHRQPYSQEPYGMPEHRSTANYQPYDDPFHYYQARGSDKDTAYYTDGSGRQDVRYVPGPRGRPQVSSSSGPRSSSRSRRRSRNEDEDEDVFGGGRRRATASNPRNNNFLHFNPTAPAGASTGVTEEPYSMPEHRSNVGGYQSHNREPFRFYQNRSSSNRTAYYTPDGPGQGPAYTTGEWSERAPSTPSTSRSGRRKDSEDKDVQRR